MNNKFTVLSKHRSYLSWAHTMLPSWEETGTAAYTLYRLPWLERVFRPIENVQQYSGQFRCKFCHYSRQENKSVEQTCVVATNYGRWYFVKMLFCLSMALLMKCGRRACIYWHFQRIDYGKLLVPPRPLNPIFEWSWNEIRKRPHLVGIVAALHRL